MKKFIFSLLLLYTSVFGQPNNNQPFLIPELPFQSEIITLFTLDNNFSIYYTYKIPYKMLVFEREGNTYNAGFRVIVEISDKNSQLVVRDIKDSNVSVDNFELTSDHSLFLQDYLRFKLNPGEYTIVAIISDLNSTDEFPLEPVKIDLVEKKDKIIQHPLVIRSQDLNCDDKKAFLLANSGGKLPFSSDTYHLIIPVSDTSVKELNISIVNNDENIFSGKIDESYLIPLGITKCEEDLVVTSDQENRVSRNFVLRNVNKGLTEGDVVLKILNEEKEIDEEFNSRIVWFNKPFSLIDPEKAIEFLIYIETDSVVSSLLDKDDSDYPKILNDYWSKFDPTPETTYNEIMYEYYSRVDYAIKEFRGISKDNGAKTDRGMIYIRFGKPEKIERSSNPQGQVIETWTYLNPERKFIFVDKKGTGNFTLIED